MNAYIALIFFIEAPSMLVPGKKILVFENSKNHFLINSL